VVPPCGIERHDEALVVGFTPDLQPSGDGEVWATGWAVDDDDDASTRLFGVATLSVGGTVTATHTVAVPVLPTDVLGTAAPLAVRFTGDGLVSIRRVTELLPADDEGEHQRTVLSMRRVGLDGVAEAAVELFGTACVDCQLTWAVAATRDRVVVVHQARPLTDDADEPLDDGVASYVVVSPEGAVLGFGDLDWIEPDDDLSRFEVDPGGVGFWLQGSEGMVWLDDDLQLLGGPYAVDGDGRVAMQGSPSGVVAAYSAGPDDVRVRSYEADGGPRGEVVRVSRGTAQAVRAGEQGVAVVVRDDGYAYVSLARDGQKVGADLRLPRVRGGWPSLGALFVDQARGYGLFTGDKNQVDRFELRCDR
jgi:hypothetical protein